MAQLPKSGWKQGVVSAMRIVVLGYAGFLVLMAGCQRHFIYYPANDSPDRLTEYARAEGYRPWLNSDGGILGWRPAAENEEGRRVVVFHGNAGFALDRGYYADGFASVEGTWNVILFEYPGYGAREGRPSEKAFYEAAEDALQRLWEEKDSPVLLVGESLGSGVATEMAKRFPDRVSGLLLITPFTDLAAVGSRHFPLLPVRFLLRDRYDNAEALKTYSGPIAVLVAGHDEVVPADLGRKLYEGYDGPRKLWVQEERTHNTLDLSPAAAWWGEMAAFFEEQAAKEDE